MSLQPPHYWTAAHLHPPHLSPLCALSALWAAGPPSRFPLPCEQGGRGVRLSFSSAASCPSGCLWSAGCSGRLLPRLLPDPRWTSRGGHFPWGGRRDVQRNTGRRQTEASSELWDPISFLIAFGRHKLWSPVTAGFVTLPSLGALPFLLQQGLPSLRTFLGEFREPTGRASWPAASCALRAGLRDGGTATDHFFAFFSPFYFRTWGKVCISQRVPETLLFYQLY